MQGGSVSGEKLTSTNGLGAGCNPLQKRSPRDQAICPYSSCLTGGWSIGSVRRSGEKNISRYSRLRYRGSNKRLICSVGGTGIGHRSRCRGLSCWCKSMPFRCKYRCTYTVLSAMLYGRLYHRRVKLHF